MSFSAWPLSSSLDSLKNLEGQTGITTLYWRICQINKQANWKAVTDDLLGKALESNVVTVEVGEEGVIRVRCIVLHAVITI
jgi:hypothetical protein